MRNSLKKRCTLLILAFSLVGTPFGLFADDPPAFTATRLEPAPLDSVETRDLASVAVVSRAGHNEPDAVVSPRLGSAGRVASDGLSGVLITRSALSTPAAGGAVRESAYPQPWVELTEWGYEATYEEKRFRQPTFKFEAWKLFQGEISLDGPPAYTGVRPPRSSFSVAPAHETRLARKLKQMARKKAYQEIRRAVKREWRDQYRDSTIRYDKYRSQMVRIRNIGKDPSAFDELDAEFNTDEVRENLFRRSYRDGERELPLLTWGPLTVTDSGSVFFDLGRFSGEDDSLDLTEDHLSVADGQQREKHSPFLASKDYRIHTRFSFDVRPERAFRGGKTIYVVDSYGIAVDIDFLSAVLGRDMVTAEFEVEVDDHEEVAAFFNFVIKGRK